jgi:ankyrin repeat protein
VKLAQIRYLSTDVTLFILNVWNEVSGKRIMELLFDSGCTDTAHVNNAGESALDVAQRNNHGSIVKMLVERG